MARRLRRAANPLAANYTGMQQSRNFLLAAVAALTVALSGCGQTARTGTDPGFASVPPLASSDAAATAIVAGQYKGTISDSAFGSGTMTAQLSQDGSTVGGFFRGAYKIRTTHHVAAWVFTNGSFKGNDVQLGKTPCTFSIAGSYDAKTGSLNGSYAASGAKRCAGEKGTFKAAQQCYYAIPAAADVDRPNPAHVNPC